MSDLHSKRQQFQERLNEITQRRKPLESNDSSLEADMLASIKTWEAHLDSLLAEFHAAKMQKPTSTVEFNRPNSRSDRTAVEWFQETDTMMLVELELGRHPLPAGFQGGYQLVESEDVMKAAIAQACGLAQAPTGLQWKDYHLGVFHIPGQGTLVNPSHYEGLTNGNPLAHAKVVSDVAMERWGWGFLLEYTTLGVNAGAGALWPAMLAYRARLPYPDQGALELAKAIYQRWILLKTGWQDWVWQYVMFKAHQPVGRLVDRPRPGRIFELLIKLQNLFPMYISFSGVRMRGRALADLVKFIFLEQAEIAPNVSNQIILNLQKLCMEHDDKVKKLVDMPLSRILGRLYYAWLENQIGILSTPYATLIATHEPQLDMHSISSAQFLEYSKKDPRLNPDARLAMLSKLDARVKYNLRSMFTVAWERLKLEGPREFFE